MIYKVVYQQNIFSNEGNPYKSANIYGDETLDSSNISPPDRFVLLDNIGNFVQDNIGNQIVVI